MAETPSFCCAASWVAAGAMGIRSSIDNRTAAARLADSPQIERKSVAAIDAGVQAIALVQKQRFAHSRFHIEMPAQNAAAELAGYHDSIARLGSVTT